MGVPRTRPAVAAVRAPLRARTDRQAAYALTLTVQQGLATPAALGAEALRIRRNERRLLVHAVVVRRDGRGRYYLDPSWPEHRPVVEVDGFHHAWVEHVVGDALRQGSLALSGDTVLRLLLPGLCPDDYFDQVAAALRQAELAA